MSIKNLLVRLAEKITGRKCCRCAHNCGGVCMHPYEGAFAKCWQSLTRPGFKKKPINLGKLVAMECDGTGAKFTIDTSGLTEEEQHQLQKIKEVLKEAGETASDGGLLED